MRRIFGKEFETFGDDNEHFLAKDIADWLGYESSNISSMVATTEHKILANYGYRRQWCVTLDGVLEILLNSTKPEALKIKGRVIDAIKLLI